MSALTQKQTNPTKDADDKIVSGVEELLEWKKAIKQQLTTVGLPQTLDQIPQLSIQNLAPLFSLYNLDISKESLATLLGKISGSKDLEDAVTAKLTNLGLSVSSNDIDRLSLTDNECVNYSTPFPRDFYILEEVKTIRPEYLAGTWFSRHNKPFKIDMEFEWVHRMYGTQSFQPDNPMSIWLFGCTGDHIWDFISEIHIHRTTMAEFSQPRNGWIEAPAADEHIWRSLPERSPLNFIENMTYVKGVRSIVQLQGGVGGWVMFEGVKNSDVTPAAARLLFMFSSLYYCARSDGRVVIKFKDVSNGAAFQGKTAFPSARIRVNNQNKFPF